jgi:magnesium transporter
MPEAFKYIRYNNAGCEIVTTPAPNINPDKLNPDHIHWFCIPISDEITVNQFCTDFNIHDLTQSDIFNTRHLPKLDEYENYLFLTAKHAFIDNNLNQIRIEHFSMVLGKNFVLNFYEGNIEDIINYIFDHVISQPAKVQKKDADFLFYLVLDKIVDKYFDVIEFLRQQAENLEELTLENDPENRTMEIVAGKRSLNNIRKFISPLLNIISTMKTEKIKFVKKQTAVYLQDIFDHIIHNLSTIDSIHSVYKDCLDLQQSFLTERANQIMKTLTIVATIFIPLTFIVGVYGMNFDYLPEIHIKWAYPVLWIIMIALSLAMIIYMKFKKWL